MFLFIPVFFSGFLFLSYILTPFPIFFYPIPIFFKMLQIKCIGLKNRIKLSFFNTGVSYLLSDFSLIMSF